MENESQSFLSLYWRGVWDSEIGEDIPKGLISIPGPTGMGKTTTIATELLPKLPKGVKVLYLTHRLRLTADFCNSCEASLGPHSYRRDQSKVNNLSSVGDDFVERLQRGPFSDLLPPKDKESYFGKLINYLRQFKALSKEKARGKSLRKLQDEERGALATKIYRQIIDVLKEARSTIQDPLPEAYRTNGDTPLVRTLRSAELESLFPAIPWYLGKVQVLAMTTQKFLRAGINFGSGICYPEELHNTVIFIDEFDYQESEILNYLTDRPQVQNSINCLRLLADGVEKLTKVHPESFSRRSYSLEQDRLPEIRLAFPEIADAPLEDLCDEASGSFPEWKKRVFRVTGKKVAKRLLDAFGQGFHGHAIVELCDRFRQKFEEAGIEWATKRFQLLSSKDPNSHPFVFQSVHIFAHGIELYQDEDFWYVQPPPSDRNAKPIDLIKFYGTLQNAIHNLNKIMTSYRHRPDHSLFGTILKVCFDEVNDNVPSSYTKYFTQIYPAGLVRQLTGDDDNEGERVPDFYTSGYCLHFFEPQDTLDQPANIASDHVYQVETSPEAIVAGLAQRNLVYGLSATNHIPRIVNSFDLSWLENELYPYACESDLILKISMEDWQCKVLRDLQAHKDRKRGKPLRAYECANDPDEARWDQLRKDIRTHLGSSDASNEYRARRVLLFLETIEWVAKNSKHIGHLVFLQSFKQIQELLHEDTRKELRFPEWLDPGATHKDGYWMALKVYEEPGHIVFYNAELDSTLSEDDKLRSEFDGLFSDGFVLLLTTQSTIANGANLEHPVPNGKSIDYGSVHILELPYYAFNKVNFDEDMPTEEKGSHEAKRQDCYRLGKARENRLLSVGALYNHLRSRLPSSKPFDSVNKWYRGTVDCKLNMLASIVQTLGRVTRKWEPSAASEVRLCHDAENIILDILESEELSYFVNEQLPCYSSLMQELFAVIAKNARLESAKQHQYPPFQKAEDTANQQIDWFLTAIERVKSGELSKGEARDVRENWRNLQRALLQQDREFECVLPGDRTFSLAECCVPAPPITPDGRIGIHNGRFVPPEAARGHIVNLNKKIFGSWMDQNDSIRFRFLGKGFVTEFRPKAPHCEFLYAPTLLFTFLRGVAAEEAAKFLLKQYNFPTEDLPDPIFEVADFQLRGKPVYIDVKNWSKRTLDLHALEKDDDDYVPKFSGAKFMEKARHKLESLSSEDPAARLVYLNLLAPVSHEIEYYNTVGRRTSREDARIVVVPSFLNNQDPTEVSEGGQRLFTLFQEW